MNVLYVAIIFFCSFFIEGWLVAYVPTMYSRHDPLPIFTSLDPHTFLHTTVKNRMKGYPIYKKSDEWISLSLSPYGQNANRGRDRENRSVPLGDIPDRWSMVALLFGPVPTGACLPQILKDARDKLFPNHPEPINDQNFIDKNERIGFFSIASRYRKRGLRFQVAAQLLEDIGMLVEGGVADICHTVTHFKNMTCGVVPDCPSGIDLNDNFSLKNINDYLMDQLDNIAEALHLKIGNFHAFSFEDLRVQLYWRHAYELNKGIVGTDYCWSRILCIPFFMAGGTIACSKHVDQRKMFGLSFGNKDHHALGVAGGINLDFVDTIEIGGEAGFTHFLGKEIRCYPLPTSKHQQGIFPFSTTVSLHPGNNWHFALKMSAYHFLSCLSFYFQYVIVQHLRDSICPTCPDTVFVPKALEKVSSWKVQVANIGFNYDITPSISLGFFWQAPLARRNAFRSTTVMFSFNAQW